MRKMQKTITSSSSSHICCLWADCLIAASQADIPDSSVTGADRSLAVFLLDCAGVWHRGCAAVQWGSPQQVRVYVDFPQCDACFLQAVPFKSCHLALLELAMIAGHHEQPVIRLDAGLPCIL
jgi:hypothetical protein